MNVFILYLYVSKLMALSPESEVHPATQESGAAASVTFTTLHSLAQLNNKLNVLMQVNQ